jgi:hypothetical protein
MAIMVNVAREGEDEMKGEGANKHKQVRNGREMKGLN